MFGWRSLRRLLRGFLLLRLVGEVVADGTARDGAEYRVMMGKMTGDGADRRAFQTSRCSGRRP